MALPLQKFHEIVFQMLYSSELGQSDFDLLSSVIMREQRVTKKTVREAQEKVHTIQVHKKEIEKIIERYSTAYALDRIHTVEKYVLFLALYELVIEKTVPSAIIIAEAKRLVRKFSTKESTAFIFAILTQASAAIE